MKSLRSINTGASGIVSIPYRLNEIHFLIIP